MGRRKEAWPELYHPGGGILTNKLVRCLGGATLDLLNDELADIHLRGQKKSVGAETGDTRIGQVELHRAVALRDNDFLAKAEIYCAGVEGRLRRVIPGKVVDGEQALLQASQYFNIAQNHNPLKRAPLSTGNRFQRSRKGGAPAFSVPPDPLAPARP